jgi:hypothetical protein
MIIFKFSLYFYLEKKEKNPAMISSLEITIFPVAFQKSTSRTFSVD